MNHYYRLVFNHGLQVWQVVAEFAKACGKSKSQSLTGAPKGKSVVTALLSKLDRLAVYLALGQTLITPSMVYALPAGAEIQFGQATFETTGNNLTIHQGTKKLITNWQSFGIGANESLQLLQPMSGVALFRVVGSEASQIYGSLNATGRLFLINPNGVLFGQGSRVDVGSLVASSMNITNADFLNNHYQFDANGSTGSVINQGVIKVADGGYIVMLGNLIQNSGTLTADNGSVVLGSAQSAMLDFYGNGLVKTRLSGDAFNALVEQTGAIQADGGVVQLATSARSSAINVAGLVQAKSLVEHNGVIRLEGGANAKVSVSGTLSAAGNNIGTKGGTIEVTGEQVALFKDAHLDASGDAGGGAVLVGGDYQGKNTEVYNARTTYVDKDASINVDAQGNGDGGNAIVWANEITRYYGSISAKGGTLSGNGGFAEVSGKRLLKFLGKADLSAANGLAGNLLLDPLNIMISTAADASTTGFTIPGDITEAFADDAGLTSNFNVTAGTGSFAGIAAGSTITLQATNDITVSKAFNVATATGSANNNLVLQANNNINVNAAVTTTGTGAITLNANADNVGGGTLTLNAALISQQGGITLSGASITGTAAGTITTTGAANLNGGNVAISSTSSINLLGAIVANGGAGAAATAGGNAGNVTISAAGVVSTAAITATGGNAGAGSVAGGGGGIINVSTITGNLTTGTITSRTGNATGTAAAGVAGSITVINTAAAGTLTTGALTTTGNNNGNGGAISLTSAGGAISTGVGAIVSGGGVALTGTAGRNAGAITINSGGAVNMAAIAASGSAGVGANQAGGNAGNIIIAAKGGVTATTIAANGGAGIAPLANGGNAASISIGNSDSGNIGVTTLNANTGNAFGMGAGGVAGSISLNNTAAAGNITTTNISTVGGTNAHGGNVLLASAADLTVTGTMTTSGGVAGAGVTAAGSNAGSVTITGVNRTVTGTITANGGAALGADQAGGNAGAVLITGSGTLNTVAINSRNGAATGIGASGAVGGITLGGTSVSAGALTTTGAANGDGGAISATSSTGLLTVGAIASSGGAANAGAAGRNAGSITLDSANAINAATITANGSAGVGANQAGGNGGAISAISTDGTVTVTALSATGGSAGTGNANGGKGGVVTLDAGGATPIITMTNVTTTGGNRIGTGMAGAGGHLIVADAALLSANTTLTTTGGSAGVGAGGDVNFAGTVDGNRSLTINSNAITTFSGAVGNTLALSSLTTNITGTTVINGGAVTTIGAQTYNDNVALGAATTLTTTNSNVTFTAATSVLNVAGNDLTIATGTGAVSATNAANNFANLAITAGSANIRDANAIVLGASNVAGAYTLTTAGAVAQSAAVTVGGATRINAGAASDVTLSNPANDFNTIAIASGRDVSIVDANALTVNASVVRKITAQTLSLDLTLGGAITATGMGSGTSINLVAKRNFLNPSNFGLTPGAGSRWLVYSTNPTTDTRGARLLTASNFKQYNTTFPDTILGAVTDNGFIYTDTPQIIATLSGTANKTYDGNATVTIGSLLVGQSGAIDGDNVNLSALTSATYDDKNAGTGKTVTSNALTMTGATNGGKQVFGYTLVSPTAIGSVGTINKAALTLNAVTDNKTYDANTSSIGAVTTSGLQGSDTVTNLGQAYASKDVLGVNGSTLNVNAGFVVNDDNAGDNYTVTQNSALGTISKAVISNVTGITANNNTYDGTTTAALSTGTAGFTGIFDADVLNVATAIGAFVDKNSAVGKAVNISGITLGGVDAGNYTLASNTASTTADIAQRAITVSAATDTKIYDGNTASIGVPTVTAGSIVAGDTGAFSQTFDNKNVGTSKTLTATGTVADDNGGGNYAVFFATDNTGVINQRAITVSAESGQNKLLGSADPLPFTFTVGGLGLVGGDILSGVLDRLPGEAIGNYAINQGSLDAGSNYTINYIGNQFAILASSDTLPNFGSPRETAGLGGLLALNLSSSQRLSIINVTAPDTGDNTDTESSVEACQSNTDPRLHNPNASVMINFGIKLPKNVKPTCI